MRLRKWLIALLAAVMSVTTLVAFAACRQDEGQNDQPVTEGPETGVYYYETPLSEEYQIALNNGNQFTFLVMGENKTGTYTLSGESLVLDFARAEDGEVTATLADDVLSLTYNNSSMRFLKKINYTVRFDAGEGSAVPSVTVVNGKTVAEPDAPVYAGHVFVGWYVDEAHSAPFQFGAQPVTSDMTLYALWSARSSDASEYTVNFDLGYTGEGVQAPADVKTVGGVVAELPQPEREGYTFLGWYVSAFNSADKLTYEYQIGQQLSEDTTLFALWRDNAATGLAAPEVSVTSEGVTWDRVAGAQSYAVTVTGPDEYSRTSGNISELHYDVDFASLTEGEYTIVVQASASATVTEDAVSSTRYFNNKALARVSGFEIVNSSMLLFEGVPNAQNYYLTIDCGNDEHAHENVALGSDLRYNIANCAMQPGGIRITVRAEAAGYASSEAVYIFNRELAQIEELRFDAATETVSWDRVPDAVGYVVSVGNGTTSYISNVNIGNTTSYSLKDFAMGDVVFSVYPQTSGYNSPVASTYTYHKATPAVPAGIRVEGNLLRWKTVAGAQTYTVRVNGTEYVASASQFDLSDYVEDGETFVVEIRANGAAGSSLWSNAQSMNYLAITEAPVYSGGILSWNPVVGAAYYEVQVNDGEPIRVANNRTSVSVTLTQGGENLLCFRFVDNDGEASAWSDAVAVQAYTIAFDERGGTPVDDIYAAYGDPIVLPSSEQSRYNFGGWYDVPGGAASGGTRFEDAVFMEREDILLYAYWTLRSYQVNLDSEGGSLTSDTASLVYSEGFTLEVPANSSSRDERYMFYGWYQYPNGAGVRYTDENGDSLVNWTIDENGTTLYAFWLQVFEFGSQTDGYSVRKGPDIGRVTSLRIPVSYNGQPVTALLGAAFEDCTNLREINIPNSIVTIGASDDRSGPFVGCSNLQTINVYEVEGVYDPQYLSIDGVLFETAESGSTTDVLRLASFPMGRTGAYTVPEGVQVLPARIFAATRITSVTLPASLMSIEQTAFYNCDYLTEVNFSATPAGSQSVALTIRSRAFQNCENLREITLPQRLSSFGSDGEDDETVNDAASVFTGCDALQYIYIENNGTTASGLSAKNGLLCDSTGETILYAPLGRSGELTIPDGVVAIGESAFEGRDGLTSVIFPYVVTTIGVDAFRNCEGLRSITFVGLENSPWETSISNGAFYSCDALERITFATNSNVVSIGNTAFAYCESLSELTLPASVQEVGQQAFRDCVSLRTLTLVGNADMDLSFGNSAFQNCVSLNTINFSEHVGEFAFHSVFDGCDNLISINVDPANQTYSSDDGILFNKDRTSLLFYSRLKGNYEIPESVKTIGASAFADNGLITSVTIGANVTVIEEGAFENIVRLGSLTIAGGDHALVIEDNAFASCTQLAAVSLPSRVRSVGAGAFEGNELLATLEMVAGLETIGSRAFAGTAVTSVTVPNTVTSLGGGAFADCASLTSLAFASGGKEKLVITDAKEADGGILSGTKVESVTLPIRLTSIGNYAFYGSKLLADVLFETGTVALSEIGDYAFAETAINIFNVPSNVVSIGEGAFAECVSLESFTFADSAKVEKIGEVAFYGSISLQTITLPHSLTSLGVNAFDGCSNLVSVSIVDGNAKYVSEDGVLYNAEKTIIEVFPEGRTAPYTLPSSITEIADNMFQNSKVTGVILHGDVTSIGDAAFYGATALKSVVMAEGLTTIGEEAFYGSGVEELTIPSTVSSIGEYAFSMMPALTKAVFLDKADGTPGALEVLTGRAFQAYDMDMPTFESRLKEIVFPSGLKEIGQSALQSTALEKVVFPSTLTKVGNNAFQYCESLTLVDFGENKVLESIGQRAFNQSGSATADEAIVKLPVGSPDGWTMGMFIFQGSNFTEITFAEETTIETFPKAAFGYSLRLSSFTIPESVTSIADGNAVSTSFPMGQAAFNNTNLSSITIPSTLTSLGNYTFTDCVNLKTVIFEESDEELDLGTGVFRNCVALNNVKLPSRIKTLSQYTFDGCTIMDKITFAENGLESIANTAFGRTAFTSMVLPEGLKSLGTKNTSGTGSVFYFCSRLESVTLPSTLESISHSALYTGSYATTSGTVRPALKNIYVKEGNKNFSSKDGVLFNGDGTELLKYPVGRSSVNYEVPSGTKLIGQYAFGMASGYYAPIQSVKLPATVTKIDQNAFKYNATLVSINFSEGLTEIGTSAFESATSLQNFTLPNSLVTLGKTAFKNAESLTTISMPDRLVSILASTFESCGGLTTVDLNNVVSIDSKAFKDCALTSISFPKDLRTLGTYAFQNNKLVSVEFPENGALTSLPNYLFQDNTSLESIKIPAYIESFGNNIFDGCTGLEIVELGANSKLSKLGTNAFKDAESLLYFGEPVSVGTDEVQYVIPAAISELPSSVFSGCESLAEICFAHNSGLLKVGSSAFSGCSSLLEIDLPESVTSIASSAFRDCESLRRMSLPDGLTELPSSLFYGCSALEEVELPANLTSIGQNVFRMSGLRSIMIPASVTEIGKYAFTGSEKLESVTFEEGSSLTEIEDSTSGNIDGAFAECTALKYINLPEGLTVIPEDLFNGCTSLESIVIPTTITRIGEAAFEGCVKLASISIYASVVEIGANAFANCPNLTLDIDERNTEFLLEDGILYNSSRTEIVAILSLPEGEVVISDTIESVPAGAFAGSAITKITLPASVTEIGANMFANCVNLKEVVLNGQITSIGANAFENCTALESFKVGRHVTSIGTSAFEGCTNLDTLTFESGGTNALRIGTYAFRNCTSLGSVLFPLHLRNSGNNVAIGMNAFEGCANLKSVSFEEGISNLSGSVSIGSRAFLNCTSLGSVSLPDYMSSSLSLAAIGSDAFKGCRMLKEVDFGSTATPGANNYYIADGAFAYCTALTELILPTSLAYVDGTDYDTGIFEGCRNLMTVTLPASDASSALRNLFNGCSNLTTVTVLPVLGVVPTCYVGDGWFAGCKQLTTVVLPDTLTGIGAAAFRNCTSLEAIALPEGLKSIGAAAFEGCSRLSDVTLPSTLTSIGDAGDTDFTGGAFAGTAIESVNLPAGLGQISANTFAGCTELTSITVDPANSVYSSVDGNLYSKDGSVLYVYAAGKPYEPFVIPETVNRIASYAFAGSNITSVVIPETVTEIGASAFANCENLLTVEFKNVMSVLPAGIFDGCMAITEVTLPNGLVSVGEKAFYNCRSLETIELPDSVMSLGAYAFGYSGLTSFEVTASIGSIAEGAFAGNKITAYSVSADNMLYQTIDGNLYNKAGTNLISYASGKAETAFVIPEGVTRIANSAFERAVNLQSVTIASTVTAIGDRAFSYCTSITDFLVAEGNQYYYSIDGMLYYWEGGSNVYVSLVAYAMGRSDTSLVLTLPKLSSSVRNLRIEEGAFAGSELEKIYMPSFVVSVYHGAFEGWSSDQTIYYVIFYPNAGSLSWSDYSNGEIDATVIAIPEDEFPTSPETPAEGAQRP